MKHFLEEKKQSLMFVNAKMKVAAERRLFKHEARVARIIRIFLEGASAAFKNSRYSTEMEKETEGAFSMLFSPEA